MGVFSSILQFSSGGFFQSTWYDNVAEVIRLSWWVFLFFVLSGVAFALFYGFAVKVLRKREKKLLKKMGEEGFTHLLKIISFSFLSGYIFLSLYILTYTTIFTSYPTIHLLRRWIYALLLVYILYLTAKAITITLDRLYRGRVGRGEEARVLPEATLTVVHLIIKYLTLLFFTVLAAVVLFSALGQYEMVKEGLTSFFIKNAGYITFLLILILSLLFTSKFVRAVTRDMKRGTGTLSDQMVETVGKSISFLIYFVVGLILVFTLLSMAHMQEVGSTLVIIFSTMVGLIVAMAATGSIGNILSGLVLQSTKPYEIGDRAKVARDLLGDIESTSLFFTRIRTLNNEVVTVPNNYVLSDEIVNYSRSKVVGIEIRLSIGYDVSPKVVRKLLKEAALSTQGVLSKPKPQALAENFQDHAISYLLRAFTDLPKSIPYIRSKIIENVYDSFYSRGIEILSPGYFVKREGVFPSKDEIIATYNRGRELGVEEAAGEALKALQ
ncbi:MAG: mechanosensitive ion channel [Thermoplasmata archaeon]|nr:mechanosensitive ion channel [Thermoplasmata archaeon]